MRSKVNPVVIGMFVIGAAILATASVMVFGAAKFFTHTEKCISYFSESVNGLDVGAPLKFKGVKIGKVESIRIGSHSETMKNSSVAVVYSIDIDMLRRKIGDSNLQYEHWLKQQISEGMRAKLNYQSIVTGMLYIEFDYLANPGDKYELRYGGTRFIEVPSTLTGIAETAKAFQDTIDNISKIDFESIGKNANMLLANINSKLGDLDVKAINDSAITALNSIDALASDPNLKNTLLDLDILMKDSSAFVRMAQGEFMDLSSSAKKTFANADSVLDNVNAIIMPQSPLRYELAALLRSVNQSVSSLSNLTDYIQRNPSSLLTGKAKSKNSNQQ